jgi:putative tryptophan/tyrosine transport system substrate-binding protein
MKRREFITLLGGAAAAWPLAARAQQPGRVRRIGVLMGFAESDPEGQRYIKAFLQGLQERGWAPVRRLKGGEYSRCPVCPGKAVAVSVIEPILFM